MKNNSIYYLLIFILISLLPFYWLRGGLPVCSWDTGYGFFSPKIGNDLNIIKYLWDYSVSTGRSMAFYHSTFLPTSLLYKILDSLPTNPAFKQALLFSGLIMTALISMYLMVLEIFRENRDKMKIAFFSSLFYVLNFGTLFWFIYNVVNFIYVFAYTPLFLYLLLKGLNENKFIYVIPISASLMFFSVVFFNPSFGILMLFIGSLFCLLFEGFKKIKFILHTILLSILLNSFWILPAFCSFQSSFREAYTLSSTKISFAIGSTTNLLSTITLLPKSDLWFLNISARSWIGPYYTNWLFKLIPIIFVIVIFSTLFEYKKNKKILFFLFLALLGIFLAKGGNAPLGGIMQFVMDSDIPYFAKMYAVCNQKFSILIIIPYSVLFGYGLNYISSLGKTNKKVSSTCIIFILSLLFISAFPFWTGEIVTSPIKFGGANVSSFVEIPNDYFSAKVYLDNDKKDYRLLSLPLMPYNMGTYKWNHGYLGENFEKNYFDRSTFSIRCFEKVWDKGMLLLSKSIDFEIKEMENIYHTSDFNKILGVLNVKYVILHHDIDLIHGNYRGKTLTSPEKLEKILIKNNFSYRPFGKLDLYKISDEYFLPHIYPTTTPILVNGGIDEMFKVATSSNFTTGNNALFLSNQISKDQWQFLKKYNTTIFIDKKITDTPTYDGLEKPFNWATLSNSTIEARYHIGGKSVVRTDGKEIEDTLSFPSLETCPYEFPSFSSTGWNALNSTLIYIKTGEEPLRIDGLLENEKPIEHLVGIWWETSWMGMGTKPGEFPILIPSNQKAIIQINHIIKDNITLYSLDLTNLSQLSEIESPTPTITFKKTNPTKYQVRIENATKPFFLVFSESYHPQWKAYAEDKEIEFKEIIASYDRVKVKEARHEMSFTPSDTSFLFAKPVDDKYHFTANGYANAWYINPEEIDKKGDGSFVVTLYFLPQSLFYLGLFISGMTFIGCVGYLVWDWRRGRGDGWALRIVVRLHNAGSVVSRGFREGVLGLKMKLRGKKQ